MTAHALPADLQNDIDAALLSGDLDQVIPLLIAMGVRPSTRAVAEIAMHKARTGRLTLPADVREASRQWLVARGHTPFGQ